MNVRLSNTDEKCSNNRSTDRKEEFFQKNEQQVKWRKFLEVILDQLMMLIF